MKTNDVKIWGYSKAIRVSVIFALVYAALSILHIVLFGNKSEIISELTFGNVSKIITFQWDSWHHLFYNSVAIIIFAILTLGIIKFTKSKLTMFALDDNLALILIFAALFGIIAVLILTYILILMNWGFNLGLILVIILGMASIWIVKFTKSKLQKFGLDDNTFLSGVLFIISLGTLATMLILGNIIVIINWGFACGIILTLLLGMVIELTLAILFGLIKGIKSGLILGIFLVLLTGTFAELALGLVFGFGLGLLLGLPALLLFGIALGFVAGLLGKGVYFIKSLKK